MHLDNISKPFNIGRLSVIQENNHRTKFWSVLFFYMLYDVWRNKLNSIVFIFTRWLIRFLFSDSSLSLFVASKERSPFTKLIHFQDYLLHVNDAYKKWYKNIYKYMHLTHIYKVVAKSYVRSRKIDILKKVKKKKNVWMV